jgi:hypothetical protein
MSSTHITTDGSRVIFLGVQVGEGDCGSNHHTAMFERILADGSTAQFAGQNACQDCAEHALELAAFIREGDIRSLIQQGVTPAADQALEFAAATYGA